MLRRRIKVEDNKCIWKEETEYGRGRYKIVRGENEKSRMNRRESSTHGDGNSATNYIYNCI